MPAIEAIYQEGVFKPSKEIHLPENQQVFLSVQTPSAHEVTAWLAEVRELQRQIVAERGFFPDSAPDFAADRVREE